MNVTKAFELMRILLRLSKSNINVIFLHFSCCFAYPYFQNWRNAKDVEQKMNGEWTSLWAPLHLIHPIYWYDNFCLVLSTATGSRFMTQHLPLLMIEPPQMPYTSPSSSGVSDYSDPWSGSAFYRKVWQKHHVFGRKSGQNPMMERR